MDTIDCDLFWRFDNFFCLHVFEVFTICVCVCVTCSGDSVYVMAVARVYVMAVARVYVMAVARVYVVHVYMER